jgi:hypothetical protein
MTRQFARERKHKQRLPIFGNKPSTLPPKSAVTRNPLSAISNEVPALVINEVSPELVGTKNNVCPLMTPMKSWYHLHHPIRSQSLLFRS